MLCGQQRQPALARNACAVLRAPRCVVLHRKTNKQQGPRGSSRIYSSSGGSSDGPSSGPSGEGSVDIDQLAKLLSQRAQALRESYDEKEFKSTYQDYDAPNTSAMALPTTMLVTGSQVRDST